MDLSKMSCSDLNELQKKLKVIAWASETLSNGGLEPVISLTGEASMITMEPILSMGPVPEVELFEAVAAFPAPEGVTACTGVIMEPVEVQLQQVAEVSAKAAPLPQAEPAAPIAAAAPPVDAPPREFILVSGPVTRAEKAEIESLHKQGLSTAEIAMRINRHGSIVGTVIRHLKRVAEAVAPKAAPAAKADVSLAAPMPDQPRANATEIQKPGGERGELQQLANAEVAPVQSGAVGGPAPAAAPDEARPVYTGESKRIWDHIKGLGFPKGWDAELDHEVCDAFGRGTKLDRLALDLDVDAKLIRDRYAALTGCIRDDRGRMSIDGLERLVRIVRDRVKAERAGTKAA